MRYLLFRDITQCELVVIYPTFRDILSVPSSRVKQSKKTIVLPVVLFVYDAWFLTVMEDSLCEVILM
jgi:hypothetical protein